MYIDIKFSKDALSYEDADKIKEYLTKSSFYAGLKEQIKKDALSGLFDEEEQKEEDILKLLRQYNEALVAQIESFLKAHNLEVSDYTVLIKAKTSEILPPENDDKIHISDEF